MSALTTLTLAECRSLPVSQVGRTVKRLAEWDTTAAPIAARVVIPSSWWTAAIQGAVISNLKQWWQTTAPQGQRDLSPVGATLQQLTLPTALKKQLIQWYHHLPANTMVAVGGSSPVFDRQPSFYAVGDSNVLEAILKAWKNHCAQLIEHHAQFRLIEWELAGGAVTLTPLAQPLSSGEVTTLHPYTHSKVITIRGQWGIALPEWRPMPSDEFRVDPRTNVVTFRQVVSKPQQLAFDRFELVWRSTPGKQVDQPCLSEQAVQELAQLAWRAKQQSFAHLRIAWQYHQGQFVFIELEPLTFGEHPTATSQHILAQGRSIQAGYVRQRAVLVPRSLRHFTMPAGAIMVVESWANDLAKYLPQASGLICAGPLQHAGALKLIREFQIPTIDKVTGVTQIIKKFPEIVLHAGLGRVLQPQPETLDTAHQPPRSATQLWLSRSVNRPTTQQAQLADGFIWDGDFVWAKLGTHPLHLAKTNQLAAVVAAYSEELDLSLGASATEPTWAYRLSHQGLADWATLTGSGNWSDEQVMALRGPEIGLTFPSFIKFQYQIWQTLRQRYPGFKRIIIPQIRSADSAHRYLKLWRELDQNQTSVPIWLELASPSALLTLSAYDQLGVAGLIIDGPSLVQLLGGAPNNHDREGWHQGEVALLQLIQQQLQARHDQLHLPLWVRVPTAEPHLIGQLLELGIQGLIVQPEVAAVAKHVIMETEAAQFAHATAPEAHPSQPT